MRRQTKRRLTAELSQPLSDLSSLLQLSHAAPSPYRVREHANVFKVEKQKFPRACKYLLRCAQLGLWVSVAYQAALTNHRDFQLLPLMDEPVFQSGAIDVLAESGQPAPGTRRPNRAPWGSQFLPTFPQFLLFYFFSVPSYFFSIPTHFSYFFSVPSYFSNFSTFS